MYEAGLPTIPNSPWSPRKACGVQGGEDGRKGLGTAAGMASRIKLELIGVFAVVMTQEFAAIVVGKGSKRVG